MTLSKPILALHRPLRTLSTLLAACLVLGACSGRNGQNETNTNPTLFTDASAEGDINAMSVSLEAFSVKRRLVRVQVEVLREMAAQAILGEKTPLFQRVHLNFFEDEGFFAEIEDVEKISETNMIFSGRIVGEADSAVTLVLNSDRLTANARRDSSQGSDESYEVRYVANGLHSVHILKDENESECESPESEHEAGEEAPTHDVQASATGEYTENAIVTVDILGAYTPGARSASGGKAGIVSLIQLGISDTNRALIDSGANMRVRLVGTIELNSNETGNWSRDLGYLKGKTDGRWDAIHAERARVGADQVILVAQYSGVSGTAGIGYVNAASSSAFSIVKTSSFRIYSFSHELGHNWGLRHTDGYVNTSGRFRTILAYGSYTRIRRYSNPTLRYNGYTTGTSSKNEVRLINGRASVMARMLATKI